MKKLSFIVLLLLASVLLFACKTEPTPTPPIETPVTYTVVFNTDGGGTVNQQTIDENGLATEPADPTKEGYVFVYWYTDNQEVAYDFNLPVTADLTLTAKWDLVPEPPIVKTNEEKIAEDIAAVLADFYVNRYYVNTPANGPVNGSSIRWSSDNKYISDSGVILPVLAHEEETTSYLTAKFTLDGTVVEHQFSIDLSHSDPVVISEERTVPFENITTEYEVSDGQLDLYFEQDGSVPYVKVEDFFNLLSGFIDPSYVLNFVTDGNVLTISYQYIDEDEQQAFLNGESEFNGVYDLTIEIDADANTLTTPDPGFYWAYVYSTETNYGRHIEYDRDNENAYFEEGDALVYDLDLFGLDIVVYEDEVVIPYYIANQLFAGSSYYNVYYNYDGLYGIYSLPDAGSDEYKAIRTSTVNSTTPPADLIAYTFNYLAFAFDYFYGLKEIKGIDSYYDLLFDYRDEFLSDSALTFEKSLFEFINQVIDEPHTSYGYPGYFNRSTYQGPSLISLSQLGPRVRAFYNDGLYAVDDAIVAKWDIVKEGSEWAYSHPDRPQYWFLDELKTSVVLSLDEFVTSDIEEDAIYSDDKVANILDEVNLLPAINGGSKYFYYNSSTQEFDAMEVLIKGLSDADLITYQSLLVTNGFSLNTETNYYEKTVGDFTYYLHASYDLEQNLFYLGVVKLASDLIPIDELDMLEHTAEDLYYADSAVFMEIMMEAILSESSSLENIILDVTFNTGGNVGALYRVVGFITSLPFAVSSMDGDTNGVSTSYVYIDGVPVYENLNWALLISPATFSAANSLATIFQDNDLGPIIGTKSGGGASSITPVLLPNGTAFTMSSNNINAYRTGDGTELDPYVYHSNEYGIDPDFEVPIYSMVDGSIFANIYDNQTLLTILEQVYGSTN